MHGIPHNQPLILLPNRVWRTYNGGALLDRLEGKTAPADSHFPEDWVGSTTRAVNPGREHLADEGVSRAQTVEGVEFSMEDVLRTSPEEALGAHHVRAYGTQPQLLVKLLDAAIRLHIQAHPSVAWSMKHLGASSGKTEAWWILDSREPDPWVILGFQHPPSPSEWKRIVDQQDLDAMMRCFDRIPVSPGDVLLIEGGVPHAIGPGIFMVEIQEPTDYVVRCEYAHGGFELPESARTMGLGIDRVLDMFDYKEYPAEMVKQRFGPRRRILSASIEGKEEVLLEAPQTDRVEVRKLDVQTSLALQMDGRFSILIVLDGSGTLEAGGAAVPLQPWSRIFLPAALSSATIHGTLRAARCLPPLPPS